jgi:hypothetical protein
MGSSSQRRNSRQKGEDPALNQVGRILLYEALLEGLVEKDPSFGPPLTRANRCLGRLEKETGWEIKTLLRHLGCDTETQLLEEELKPGQLSACTDYMEWIEGLLRDFDLQDDKRIVLKGASDFFEAAGRNLPLAKEIMTEEGEPALYLSLGESGQAWNAATRQLDGPVGDRARRIHDSNLFADGRNPHISPARIEMLASANAVELLGDQVAGRMREHVITEGCSRCEPMWKRIRTAYADSGSISVLR